MSKCAGHGATTWNQRCARCGHKMVGPQTRSQPLSTWPGEIVQRRRARRQGRDLAWKSIMAGELTYPEIIDALGWRVMRSWLSPIDPVWLWHAMFDGTRLCRCYRSADMRHRAREKIELARRQSLARHPVSSGTRREEDG